MVITCILRSYGIGLLILIRESKSNGPFQHLVHPSSIKKTPVCRTEKVKVYDLEVI